MILKVYKENRVTGSNDSFEIHYSCLIVHKNFVASSVNIILSHTHSGYVQEVDENHIDSMSALMGCSPAWYFMILEAMSDGGVKNGVPRSISYTLAAKAMEGAAKMVLQTGKHPGRVSFSSNSNITTSSRINSIV